MFAKLKLYSIAILGFITAVLYGLLNRSKAKFAQYRERQAERIILSERDARIADAQAKDVEEQEVKDAKNSKSDYYD